MWKILMYLWTIINDLVDRAEATGEPGVSKQSMVVDAVNAVLIATGRERLTRKFKNELKRVVNAVVAIKNLFGELDNRKGQPITQQSIVGALK